MRHLGLIIRNALTEHKLFLTFIQGAGTMTHGGIINVKEKIEERSKIGQRDPIFSPMVWKKSTRTQAYQVYLNH